MKAAVCHEFGRPLVIEEIALDPPQVGEVRVRLKAVAVCHSDVHLIQGDWEGELPVVPGHEAAGIVVEVGPQVSPIKPGDHVVVSLLRSCGSCRACTTGAPHLCEGHFALNQEPRLHTGDGRPILHGMLRTAAFAEETVVHQSQVVPIPADMPLDSASLLACGVITGWGAVVNTARVRPGRSVTVIGCGGVGLNAVQGARLSGANPIIAVDLLDNKLEAARLFGATHTLNARATDARKGVRGLTGGRGADYTFVTVGSLEAVQQGYSLTGNQGTIVLVGIPDWRSKVPIPLGLTILGERRILGSFMGSARLSLDVPRLVDLYRDGRLKLDELITGRYRLEQINEAIADLARGDALRNVILFD